MGSCLSINEASALQALGQKGQTHTSDRVWAVKCHYPSSLPNESKFTASKVVCVVRNPLDLMYEGAQRVNSLQKDNSGLDVTGEFKEWFDWWVAEQTTKYAEHYSHWIRYVTAEPVDGKPAATVPVYFVRFEDFAKDPKAELGNVLKFMLDLDDIAGTNLERRINKIKLEKLQTASRKDKYTEEQLAKVQETLAHQMYWFGYSNHESKANPDPVFAYQKHDPANAEVFQRYLAFNSKAVERCYMEAGTDPKTWLSINSSDLLSSLPAKEATNTATTASKSTSHWIHEPAMNLAAKAFAEVKPATESAEELKNEAEGEKK